MHAFGSRSLADEQNRDFCYHAFVHTFGIQLYADELTGEPIARDVADAAAEEECRSMEEWTVWDLVPRRSVDRPPLGTSRCTTAWRSRPPWSASGRLGGPLCGFSVSFETRRKQAGVEITHMIKIINL